MTIYVDADAFPNAVKDILTRACLRRGVALVFVSNKPIRIDDSPLISAIIVPEGPDVADDRIAALAQPGDLVVTTDIPLADRVVAKGGHAINPRGVVYTEHNIKDRLMARDLMTALRDTGAIAPGGPPAFGRADRQAFADALDRFLNQRPPTR